MLIMKEGILECFRILNSVAVLEGVVQTRSNESFITLYTSCICSNQQIYYYSTYTNPQIYAIDLKKEALDGNTLKFYSYPERTSHSSSKLKKVYLMHKVNFFCR